MTASEVPSRFLIAVGGNAIHPGDIRGTPEEQVELAARTGEGFLVDPKVYTGLYLLSRQNGPPPSPEQSK